MSITTHSQHKPEEYEKHSIRKEVCGIFRPIFDILFSFFLDETDHSRGGEMRQLLGPGLTAMLLTNDALKET